MKFPRARLLKFLKAAAPYLAILILTALPFCIFFTDVGMTTGDDCYWHQLELADLAYGFEHGFTGLSLGHNLISFTAVDIYGFYGPFPHYFVVILYEMWHWAGASLTGTLKFAILFFCFLSNLAVYALANRISSRRSIGFLATVIYNFLPYKMYCVLYRAAYPEAIALCFIPLVYYGLYRLIHDEKWRVGPYVILTLSAASIVLTHPITALVTAASCVAFLVFSVKAIARHIKEWRRLVSFFVSILLVVGFVTPYVFTALRNTSGDLYNISDGDIMWTTLSWLSYWIGRTSTQFTGFLNFEWLVQQNAAFKVALSASFYVVSAVLMIVFDRLFRKLKNQEKWRYLADAAILFLPSLCILAEAEAWLSLLAFYLLFLLFDLFAKDPAEPELSRKPIQEFLEVPEVYFLCVSMIVLVTLIYVPDAWKAVPRAFYNIQFPYRLWGLFGFFAVLLIVYLAKAFRDNRTALASLGVVGCALLMFCQGPIDKRISIFQNHQGYWHDASVSEVQNNNRIGWQNEYLPRVFSESDYHSEYSASLYDLIHSYLADSSARFPVGIEGYFDPAFLEGEGRIEITALNSPDATFDVTVESEDALIQIPQFYYDGYEAKLTAIDGEVSYAPIRNVDGLVAFEVASGSYALEVSFPGPLGYRIGRVTFWVSAAGTLALGGWGLYERRLRSGEKKPPKTKDGASALV